MIKLRTVPDTFPESEMNNPGTPNKPDLTILEREGFSDNGISSLAHVLPPGVEKSMDVEYANKAWQLVRVCVKNQAEMINDIVLLFRDYPEYTVVDLLIKGIGTRMTYLTYLEIMKFLETPELDAQTLEKEIYELADDLGIDLEALTASLRTAITGRNSRLPLFLTMELLGEKRLRERICGAMRSLACLYR